MNGPSNYFLYSFSFSFGSETFLKKIVQFWKCIPYSSYSLPRQHSGKEPACQCRRPKRCRFDPWIRKIPWSRSRKQAVSYWSREQATSCWSREQATSCWSREQATKEVGNPLQYSCLQNPVDRGAWQAIVHGVAKSQTQLLRVLGMQTLMTQLTPRHFQYLHHQLHATQGSEVTFRSIRHFSERAHMKRKIEVFELTMDLRRKVYF